MHSENHCHTRLFVRELPSWLSPAAFRQHFSSSSRLTDARLLLDTQRRSRRCGYLGFKTHDEAKEAIARYDRTFIGTTRIFLDWAKELGSPDLPVPRKHLSRRAVPDGEGNRNTSFTKHFDDNPKATGKVEMFVKERRRKTRTWENNDTVDQEMVQSPADANDSSASSECETEVELAKDPSISDAEYFRSKQVGAAANSQNPRSDEQDAMLRLEQTRRLYIWNIPFTVTAQELRTHFGKFGPIEDLHLPLFKVSKSPRGFAFVTYENAADALAAFKELKNTSFQGRHLSISPAEEKEGDSQGIAPGRRARPSYRDRQQEEQRKSANKDINWNSLFMSADAVLESVAQRYGIRKGEILESESSNAAVRLALAETHVINETKTFFEGSGIDLSSFGKKERSRSTILVKNIPYGSTEDSLKKLFEKFGDLNRVIVPPSGTLAVVEFLNETEAKVAFQKLAYRRLEDKPLFLEWAPLAVFVPGHTKRKVELTTSTTLPLQEMLGGQRSGPPPSSDVVDNEEVDDIAAVENQAASVYVRNVSFATTQEDFAAAFSHLKGFRSAINKVRRDPKRPGELLSMGYGFVEFKDKKAATRAIPRMKGTTLDGHTLEFKLSDRVKAFAKADDSKATEKTKTRLIVHNLPFSATKSELRDLISQFGSVKSVRIPRKMIGGHRGFAFVDFRSPRDADAAREALAHTHFYGRRLVLEEAAETEDQELERQKRIRELDLLEAAKAKNKRQRLQLGDDSTANE